MIVRSPKEIASSEPGMRTVVIVGAGTMGMYLTGLLQRAGFRVIAVEAGARELGSFDESTFRIVGKHHRGISVGRSKTLGGTSNLWGGQMVEFQESDFLPKEYAPEAQWPVPFSEISAYYQKTYSNLGIPDLHQKDAWVWSKVSGKPEAIKKPLEMYLTRWLRVPNIAAMFDADVRDSQTAFVLLEHSVIGFLGEGAQLKGVRIVGPEGETVITGDYVILSAGTIESVRLLFAAQRDPKFACPWKDNDMLGRYFMDHLGNKIASLYPTDRKEFANLFTNIVVEGWKFQPKIRFTSEEIASGQRLNCQGFVAFETSVGENFIFLKQFVKAALAGKRVGSVSQFFRVMLSSWKHMVPLMWRYIVEHRVFVPKDSGTALFVQAEQIPNKDSRIEADWTSTDKFGLPRVLLNWQLDGREAKYVKEFALACKEQIEGAGLARVELEPETVAADQSLLDKLGDTIHQSGGTVMGADEKTGFVDRDLKVFGTDNLYIAGGSTFRSVGSANTGFVALCFCTRLVEHLVSLAASKGDLLGVATER